MFKHASVKLKEMDAFLQEEMKNNSFSFSFSFSVFDGICLSGGGAKGIGHLGVIEALGTEGLNNMTQVSCASAGATMGLLVALGMAPDEIIREIKKQELKLNPILFDTQIKNALFDTLNGKMTG